MLTAFRLRNGVLRHRPFLLVSLAEDNLNIEQEKSYGIFATLEEKSYGIFATLEWNVDSCNIHVHNPR